MKQPPVYLLGQDCMTGLQAARILHARGVDVLAFARNTRSPFCRTRAVHSVIRWHEDAPPQILQRTDFAVRPLLLPCTDDAVRWLNAHRDVLDPFFEFVLPEREALDLLIDKSRFYRHALAHDVPIPDTLFLDHESDCALVGPRLGFPCVVKPPLRTQAWRAATHRKVLFIKDVTALLDAFRLYRGLVDELIAQRWIVGGDDEMYSLYSCLDRASMPLAQVVAHKIRQWPLGTGCGSLAEQTTAPVVAERGLHVLQVAGYAGLSSVQFKRDPISGRFYVLEVNAGRPALNMPVAEHSGVEMLYTFYSEAVGLPLPEARHVTQPGAKWICWQTDLAASWRLMRQRRLSPTGWLRSLRGRKWSAVESWSDPTPFLFDVLRKVGRPRPSRERFAAGSPVPIPPGSAQRTRAVRESQELRQSR